MAILKWKSWESMGAESCARTALARARFQTSPTSLLTPQTCGGGLCLGHVKIMNSRSALLRAMVCAGRRGWCARCLQGTGKPPRDQSSEQARSRRTDHKSNLLLSIFRERSPTSNGGPRARHRRRGKGSNGGSSPQRGKELCLLGTASSSSAFEVAGPLRSIGT